MRRRHDQHSRRMSQNPHLAVPANGRRPLLVSTSLFSIPEVGMVHTGRAACARALKAYAAGNLPTYFAWFFDTIRSGAQAATSGVPGEA